MNSFLDQLVTGAVACGLPGSRVLVGVSGGADSVALLCGLREIAAKEQLEVVAAHLNHQLRGEESAEDAKWVESLCSSLDVPLITDSFRVADAADENGRGLEETGRRLRYEFLTTTAERENCAYVAVAHTADDQAETILHHVLRGTGISGLSGMPRTRPLSETVQLARPLLDVTRTDVESYLAGIGQDFRNDESNSDAAFTRNRIRHVLLPLLRREFNPQVEQALLRLGRQAAEVQSALEVKADELLQSALVDANENTIRLDCARLAKEPMHLVRECFSRVWQRQEWPRRRMGFDDWNALATMVRPESAGDGPRIMPGRVEASRRGELIVLRR